MKRTTPRTTGPAAALLAALLALLLAAPPAAAGCGPAPQVAWWIGRPVVAPLPPPPRLTGRVVDVDGAAVAGAVLRLAYDRGPERHGQPFAATTSDAAGRFAFGPLYGGGPRLALHVEKRGFAPAVSLLPRFDEDGLAGVVVRLPAGVAARGRVLTPDGSPAAGARVRLVAGSVRRGAPPEEAVWHPAGGDGRFELVDLAAGRYDLTAAADGHASLEVPGVVVPEGEPEVDLGSIVLAPEATVSGRLVDDLGAAVAGARVSVRFEHSLPVDTLSDADGRFVVGSLPAGRRVRLRAEADGHATATTAEIEAPADGLELTLPRGATISGQVVDAAGRPRAGVVISASVRHPSPQVARSLGRGGSSAESDGEGRFEMLRLPPGDVTLSADAASVDVAALRAGEHRAGVRLVLPLDQEISGRVTDAAGRPLAGLRVFAERRTEWGGSASVGFTEGDGSYRLTAAEGSTLYLSVAARGYRIARRRIVVAGRMRQDFTLEELAGGELRGRVVGDDDHGIGGASLTLYGLDGLPDDDLQSISHPASEADGRFSFGVVPPGRYRLEARHQASGWSTSEEVTVRSGGATEVRLALVDRSGVITGVVRGADEHRLGRLRVVAFQFDGVMTRVDAGVDFGGRFRLRVTPGTWRVGVSDGDEQVPGDETVTLAAGEEVAVELDLAAGATLSGEVLLNGEPLPDAQLTLFGPSAGQARTDWQGRFRMRGLRRGEYTLGVDGHGEERRFEIAGDREVTVDLARATLAGRVVDPDGEPIVGAEVALPAVEGALPARTDAGGRWRLLAPAGEQRLLASAAGHRPAETRVEVFAGVASELPDLVLPHGDGLVLDLGPEMAFDRVAVSLLDDTGRPFATRRRSADENGRVTVDGLPVGGVRLLVAAVGMATVPLHAEVPGPPLRLDLAPEARLELSLPALAERTLGGSVRLTTADGRRFVEGRGYRGGARDGSWPVVAGRSRIDALPAGTWTVTVEADDGRTWSATVTLATGERRRLVIE